jgi:hypothetical protein
MSKYSKPFLSLLAQHWATRFPDWKRGGAKPLPHASKGATWFNNTVAHDRDFHIIITFSAKSAGAFTADIAVSLRDQSFSEHAPHRSRDDIAELPVGGYRIGSFVTGRDIWWHLRDELEDFKTLWETGGDAELVSLLSQRNIDHWYASNYDAPLEAAMEEAVRHFSDKFEGDVLPKLKRSA